MFSLQTLANITVSLALTELIHNGFEAWSARRKVRVLRAELEKKPTPSWPVEIDTKSKVFGLHISIFLVSTAACLWLLSVIRLELSVLLTAAVLVLIADYSVTTLGFDRYHAEIGVLIGRFKKN